MCLFILSNLRIIKCIPQSSTHWVLRGKCMYGMSGIVRLRASVSGNQILKWVYILHFYIKLVLQHEHTIQRYQHDACGHAIVVAAGYWHTLSISKIKICLFNYIVCFYVLNFVTVSWMFYPFCQQFPIAVGDVLIYIATLTHFNVRFSEKLLRKLLQHLASKTVMATIICGAPERYFLTWESCYCACDASSITDSGNGLSHQVII